MANNIYDVGRYRLLTAALNWVTEDLSVSAWSGVPNFVATDVAISTIKARGHTELGFSASLTGNTVQLDGTAQTTKVIIPGVAVGQEVTWFTMNVKNDIVHDSSIPILFVDVALYLPFIGNGLDVILQPDWLEGRGWFRP